MLISPRATLTSWGSSSSDARRNTRPTVVIRSLSGCSGFGFPSWRMVRNLSIVKVVPLCPTRAWRKRIGPGR